jgi:hypothetical protein
MGDSRDLSASSGSAVLVSAMAGAVLGAAGLGWWLLRQAEQRRAHERHQRLLRLTRWQGTPADLREPERQEAGRLDSHQQERQLHERVHQLNQAIDDVRRQLEQLQPLP